MINNKVQLTQITAGGGGTSKKNTTKALYGDMSLLPDATKNNTKISLPGQSNASTGGLYGQVIGSGVAAPTYGNNGKLTPSLPTGISGATPTIKIDNSKYFDSGVVGTVGSLSGGGNKGGVTDEGVVKANPKVDNSTFNNITSSKTPTATKTSPLIEKLTNGNMASGIRDLISRLFGTKTTATNTVAKKSLGTAGRGTTYAENIGTVTSNAENTGTASGDTETATVTPTAATENNAGAAAESTGNTTESATEKPLTYAEYMEMLKSEAEASKKEADREAEIAKERAMVDAQSSYEQNKATYGSNAEQMAQMGLQGGGYSDYLQSQAYAQKRSDVQQANAVESATKAQNRATYQDYVSSINQKLAEKALYEEQLAEQRAYEEKQLADERAYNEKQTTEQREWEEKQSTQNRKDSLYATLWEGVQDTDTTYTAEAIRALGAEYGLSDAQIDTLTNLLTATKAKSEEEKSAAIKDAAISDITTNGGDVADGYLDGLKDLGLSDEDAKDVQDAINNSVTNSAVAEIDSAIKSGNIDSLEYAISKADEYYKKGSITKEKYQELYSTYSEYNVSSIMNINYGSDYSKKLSTYLSQKSELKEMLNAGKISESTYSSLISKMDAQNKNTCSGGWYVQGLGTGRNNDDVDITIGSTSRKGNGAKEYDLLCGEKIGDEALIAELNRIATGDPNKSPSNADEGAIFGNHSMSSNDKPNKLIVAYGDMYLYTKKGWVPIKDDNNNYDLKNAIRKFWGETNNKSATPTPVTYPSDSEIANKASSGTLTYHDVAKYNSGIRTQSEFARGNNADKQKYGTYQAYLKAMYEKYKK